MYIQVELYVFLQPSFSCQLKQTRLLLLEIAVQYVIVYLYVIIKWVDNFKDKAHAKKKLFSARRKHRALPNEDQLLDAVWEK